MFASAVVWVCRSSTLAWVINRGFATTGPARVLARKVCRERQGVAAPLCDDRLAIRRVFANDAVGVGNQDAPPKPKDPLPS